MEVGSVTLACSVLGVLTVVSMSIVVQCENGLRSAVRKYDQYPESGDIFTNGATDRHCCIQVYKPCHRAALAWNLVQGAVDETRNDYRARLLATLPTDAHIKVITCRNCSRDDEDMLHWARDDLDKYLGRVELSFTLQPQFSDHRKHMVTGCPYLCMVISEVQRRIQWWQSMCGHSLTLSDWEFHHELYVRWCKKDAAMPLPEELVQPHHAWPAELAGGRVEQITLERHPG